MPFSYTLNGLIKFIIISYCDYPSLYILTVLIFRIQIGNCETYRLCNCIHSRYIYLRSNASFGHKCFNTLLSLRNSICCVYTIYKLRVSQLSILENRKRKERPLWDFPSLITQQYIDQLNELNIALACSKLIQLAYLLFHIFSL